MTTNKDNPTTAPSLTAATGYASKRYEILRDNKLFGGFEEGQPARREGEVVNDEFMLREFRDCVDHWEDENSRRRVRWKWELRIILSHTRNFRIPETRSKQQSAITSGNLRKLSEKWESELKRHKGKARVFEQTSPDRANRWWDTAYVIEDMLGELNDALQED